MRAPVARRTPSTSPARGRRWSSTTGSPTPASASPGWARRRAGASTGTTSRSTSRSPTRAARTSGTITEATRGRSRRRASPASRPDRRPGLDSPGAMAVALGQVSTQEESQALFAAARDAVLIVDDARTFVDVNPAACRLLGLSARELRGRRLEDFLEPGVDIDGAWQRFLAGGEQTGELRVIRPDGEIRHVEYSATARFIADRHVAILRDVAARKRAEAEREELAQREQLRLKI